MKNIAIIVAAGSGSRMKQNFNKLFLTINDKTVIERTVDVFNELDFIEKIIVVIKKDEEKKMKELLKGDKISFVYGGKTRQESVLSAVNSIDECGFILIHDGARPLVTKEEIIKTYENAKKTGASAIGVKVKDTIKVIDDNGFIISTPMRDSLIAIQTPQIFDFNIYKEATIKALKENKDFTDDCALIENINKKVMVTLGSYENIKITTPDDIITASTILKGRK